MGTKLEVREGSGDFEDWQDAVTISAPQEVTFRWNTSEPGVTSAQWQVTDAAQGFSQPSFSIIASGVLEGAPASAQQAHLFHIDFSPFLPVPAPSAAKPYYVRLVPLKGREKLEPSLSVKISYLSAGAPTTFQPHFDIDRFEQNLKFQLAPTTIGYAYAIFEGLHLQRAGAGGSAVWPGTPQSPDKRMTTMSMSKTITATAVMKLMEEMHSQGKSITIDSAVDPYLPHSWDRGRHVNEMTFRHLLTHTSGLRPTPSNLADTFTDPDTYNNLRQTIAIGAQDADFGKASYANTNFCLFRVIIPYMAGYEPAPFAVGEDADTGKAYVSYVQDHVLEPIGLSGIDVNPTGPTPFTRYYPNLSDPTQSYGDPTDPDIAILRAGAGYWYMSAKEFAKFIASLRTGLIVSPDTFAIMKQPFPGLIRGISLGLGMYGVPSTFGLYFTHNGGLSGSYADWMIFPNGITAVILVNSERGKNPLPDAMVESAFNNSW